MKPYRASDNFYPFLMEVIKEILDNIGNDEYLPVILKSDRFYSLPVTERIAVKNMILTMCKQFAISG